MLEARIMQKLAQFSIPTCNGHFKSSNYRLQQRNPPLLRSRQLSRAQSTKISDDKGLIQVHFQSANVTVTARPGDNIYDVSFTDIYILEDYNT